MCKMRSLDLLLIAAVMIGGTLWLAAAMSSDHRHSQIAGPYVGPDYVSESWTKVRVGEG